MSEELSAAELDRGAAINEADRHRELMAARRTVVSVLWPKKRPVYLVKVWLWDTGDRFECSALDITRLSRGRPISSTIMRQLPVGALVDEAIRDLLIARIRVQEAQRTAVGDPLLETVVSEGPTGELRVAEVDDAFVESGPPAGWAAAAADDRRRLGELRGEGPGRRYPANHLAEVVRIVREAERDGRPKQAAVAEAFGISRSAAGNHIATARAKGLFEDQPRGEE